MTAATMCYLAQDVFYLYSFNKQVIKTAFSHAIRPACVSDYYEGFFGPVLPPNGYRHAYLNERLTKALRWQMNKNFPSLGSDGPTVQYP